LGGLYITFLILEFGHKVNYNFRTFQTAIPSAAACGGRNFWNFEQKTAELLSVKKYELINRRSGDFFAERI
jgi:hypothetical protein